MIFEGFMDRFTELIQGCRTIAVAGHIRPDGDAIGSCLGTALYLRKQRPGAEVIVFLEDVPEKFLFLPGADTVCNLKKQRAPKTGEENEVKNPVYDLFIALDCGAADRLGLSLPLFEAAKRTICIDHHISNPGYGQTNDIRPDASSTSEVVFEWMDPGALDAEIAVCLYMGIAHDTGVFQFSCTSPRTMEIAGALMACGIPFTEVLDRTFYSRTYLQTQVLGTLLSRAKLYADGCVIVSWVSRDELNRFGIDNAQLDLVVAQLRMTQGTDAAVFIYEQSKGYYRVSMRGNTDRVDLSQIAAAYEGGGHKRAAGCNIRGEIDEIIRGLVTRITLQLDGHQG